VGRIVDAGLERNRGDKIRTKILFDDFVVFVGRANSIHAVICDDCNFVLILILYENIEFSRIEGRMARSMSQSSASRLHIVHHVSVCSRFNRKMGSAIGKDAFRNFCIHG
jgi:hypothetical protein